MRSPSRAVARATNRKFRVFISYSRADASVADELYDFLEASGFDVRIDRRDIPYGEKWWAEIAQMIHAADTVILLVSKTSTASKECRRELEETRRLEKRLMPLRIEVIEPAAMPPAVGEYQILPPDGCFSVAENGETLLAALRMDQAWIKTLTYLADRAHRWKASGARGGELLRGRSLRDAEAWRDTEAHDMAPTAAIRDYIGRSRRAATRRITGVATVLGLVAIALGVLVVLLDIANGRANRQTRIAELQRDAALARFRATGDPQDGLDLAIEVDMRAEELFAPDPPPVGIRTLLTEIADAARRLPRLRGHFDGMYPNISRLEPHPAGTDSLLIVATEMVLVTDFEGRPLAPPMNPAGPRQAAFANDARWIVKEEADEIVIAHGSLQGSAREPHSIGISLFTAAGDLAGQVLTDHPHPMVAIWPLAARRKAIAGDSEGSLFLVDLDEFEVKLIRQGNGRAVTDITGTGSFGSNTVIVSFGDTVPTRQLALPPRAGELEDEAFVGRAISERVGGLRIGFAGWQPGDGAACVLPLDRNADDAPDAYLSCDQDGQAKLFPTLLDEDGTLGKDKKLSVTSGVSAAADCRRGDLFALGDQAGLVHVVQSDGSRVVPPLRLAEGPVAALAFSPDCKLLLGTPVIGTEIQRWDLSDVAEFGSPLFDDFKSAVSAAVSTDGKRILSLIDTYGGDLEVRVSQHGSSGFDRLLKVSRSVDRGAPRASALSPAGDRIAVSANGRVEVVAIAGSTVVAEFDVPASHLAFSPDGTALFAATDSRLIMLRAGSQPKDIWDGSAGIRALFALPPDAPAALAVADSESSLVFFDTGGERLGRSSALTLGARLLDGVELGADVAAAIAAQLKAEVIAVTYDPRSDSYLAAMAAAPFATAMGGAGTRVFRIPPDGSDADVALELDAIAFGLGATRIAVASRVVDGTIALVIRDGRDSSPRTELRLVEVEGFRTLARNALPSGAGHVAPIAVWLGEGNAAHVVMSDGVVVTRHFDRAGLREAAKERLEAMAAEAAYERLLAEANELASERKHAEGIEAARRAAELVRPVSMPHLLVGNWICNRPTGRGDCAEAERAYSRAIEAVPYQPLSHLQRGKLRYFADDLEGAVADLKLAADIQFPMMRMEADPNGLPGSDQLAKALWLGPAMAYEPRAFHAYALADLGQWEEAEEVFAETENHHTPSMRDRELRTLALIRLGHPLKALTQIEAIFDGLDAGAVYSSLEGFDKRLKAQEDRTIFSCRVANAGAMVLRDIAPAEKARAVALIRRGVTGCTDALLLDPADDGLRAGLANLREAARDFDLDPLIDEALLETPVEALARLVAAKDMAGLAAFHKSFGGVHLGATAGLELARLSVGSDKADLPVTADIEGVWVDADGKPRVRISSNADGKQIWTNVDPENPHIGLGEVLAETRAGNPKDGWPVRGKHVWIGDTDVSWGEQGALVAAEIGGVLFYARLDSRYKGGWTLRRRDAE